MAVAHININKEQQSVQEHLTNTGNIAKKSVRGCGLDETVYIAGLVHDIGKYTSQFQDYINHPGKYAKGSVIHSFQGCKYILDRFHDSEDQYVRLSAELIAYAIGAHHGLFDVKGPTNRNENGFDHRREKTDIEYNLSVDSFIKEVIDEEHLKCLILRSAEEIKNINQIFDTTLKEDSDYTFMFGLLERLILSALIEGDRRDTSEFMNCISFPDSNDDMTTIWETALKNVESGMSKFKTKSAIDKARKKISVICFEAAQNPCGIYRLNVPPGGGKTLSSLRYALAHAKKYNKKHIIFASPLLSILEQNAAVIREFVNDDSLILEHHSNIIQEGLTQQELDERELYIQTWDSPIIITTMVQLLITVFSGKSSSIRRFHSLADSVLVIDEVQTVPTKMLSLFNLAIQFLCLVCKTTVVLCSATQPYLESASHPVQIKIGNLVPYDQELWNIFKRTEIKPLPPVRKEHVPSLIRNMQEIPSSMLIVCNTKAEAANLFRELEISGQPKFHLSAGMCIQHRRDIVKRLKDALSAKENPICVSTQVIEAGVDISFQKVVRFTAGMDSIVQSAGRCNRNGESSQPQPVFVVKISDENLGCLYEINQGKMSTIALFDMFENDEQKFNGRLDSDEAIRNYYKSYYEGYGKNYQDFRIEKLSTTIFDLLSENTKYINSATDGEKYHLNQAFLTAGNEFKVFDENTHDIIVPYGEGTELIKALCSADALTDPEHCKKNLKIARSYTVSVYDNQFERLLSKQAIYPICNGFAFALSEQYYDGNLGLSENTSKQEFLEV